ncbi:MAG TPA: TMEM175 family protein, partial [Vicinamibacteria bacterium]|nr:TMEM175 family protein [Vicinamibacteria bacterium]
MGKGRLEAFSDGVIAIIITIMALELRLPHDDRVSALRPLLPAFLSYMLSFVFLGIYWCNHHHLFQAVREVGGGVLWANLHLLFWLSLIPAVTAWMGETGFAAVPASAYGAVMLGAAVAYYVLVRTLLARHGSDSALARAIGDDRKGKVSVLAYAAGMVVAARWPLLACALYVAVAIL